MTLTIGWWNIWRSSSKPSTGLIRATIARRLARLTRAAEQAKITLSSQPFARVREEYLMEKQRRPLHLDVEIARHEFEDLIHDLLQGTLTAFDAALSDAGLSKGDLAKVLLSAARRAFRWCGRW